MSTHQLTSSVVIESPKKFLKKLYSDDIAKISASKQKTLCEQIKYLLQNHCLIIVVN